MNYDIPPNTDNENLDDNKENLQNMNEQVYETPTPEQSERLEQWKSEHPGESIPFELRRTPENEIAELNKLLEDFEKKHDLSRLHEIKELSDNLLNLFKKDRSMSEEEIDTYLIQSSPEDVENYIRRRDAKADLIPITVVLQIIENETKTTPKELRALKLPYRELSKAVGMITANSNVIDHTR